MSRRPRLLSILPTDLGRVRGGGERYAIELHAALRERLLGHDTLGLGASSAPEDHPLPPGWVNALGGHDELPPPADALSTKALARALISADIVVVHQWYTRACALARLVAAVRPRARVVTFDHGGASRSGRQLARLPLPLPDLAAVQSRFASELTPMRARRVALVRGGIADEWFVGTLPPRRPVDFLMVARFEPHKGQLRLLEALPAGARVHLVGTSGTGDIAYRERVFAAAAAAGIEVSVDLGDEDLRAAYRSARFVVQVPIWGGGAAPPELLGMSLLEGMASGCVPICPRVGPGAEFVRDRHTGYTYQAESVEDLRRVLTVAMRDSASVDALSAAARRESERWTWRAAAEATLGALGLFEHGGDGARSRSP